MSLNFECHITTQVRFAPECERIAKQFGWKTSEIKRDPILGDASHFYLTHHDTDYVNMFDRMKHTVRVMESLNVEVLREKIELIMYDTKTMNKKGK